MITIAFFSDKNNVGKSTFTLITSANFSTKYNEKVCIVDLSDKEDSLFNKREREWVKYKEFGYFQKKRPNPIIKIKNFEQWKNWKRENQDEFDITFIDLDNDIDLTIEFLLDMDYIIILSDVYSKKENQLNIDLYNLFNNIRLSNIQLKKVFFLYNKVDAKNKQLEKNENLNVLVPSIDYQSTYDNLTTLVEQGKGDILKLTDLIYKKIKEEDEVKIIN